MKLTTEFMMHNNSNLIKGYTKALLAVASQSDQKEYFNTALGYLSKVINNLSIKKIISQSSIAWSQQATLIINIFTKMNRSHHENSNNNNQTIDPNETLIINFVKLLAQQRSLKLIPSIYKKYDKIHLTQKNQLRVDVTSAIFLDEVHQAKLREHLTGYFYKHQQKKPLVTFNIKQNIIAGILIKYNNEIIDYSTKGSLRVLKQTLTK